MPQGVALVSIPTTNACPEPRLAGRRPTPVAPGTYRMETNMYSDNHLFFDALAAQRAGKQPFAERAIETVGAECSIV